MMLLGEDMFRLVKACGWYYIAPGDLVYGLECEGEVEPVDWAMVCGVVATLLEIFA